jgi:hypothetical protein
MTDAKGGIPNNTGLQVAKSLGFLDFVCDSSSYALK